MPDIGGSLQNPTLNCQSTTGTADTVTLESAALADLDRIYAINVRFSWFGNRRASAASRSFFSDTQAVNETDSVKLPKVALFMPPQMQTPMARIAAALLDDVVINLCTLQTVAVIAPHIAWHLSTGGLTDEAIQNFDINYVAECALSNVAGEMRLSIKLFKSRGRTIVWADGLVLSPETSAVCFRGLALGLALSLTDAVEKSELSRFEEEQNARVLNFAAV